MKLTIEEMREILLERLSSVGKFQGSIRGKPIYSNPKDLVDEIMYDLRELQRIIEENNAEAKK
jgi:hypothetical protein